MSLSAVCRLNSPTPYTGMVVRALEDDMARPPGAWMHEPYYASPRDHHYPSPSPSNAIRLPPCASLASGPPPPPPPPPHVAHHSASTNLPASASIATEPIRPVSNRYHHEFQTPSPIQQQPTSSPQSYLNPELYGPILIPPKPTRAHEYLQSPPGVSPTASDRSADDRRPAAREQYPLPPQAYQRVRNAIQPVAVSQAPGNVPLLGTPQRPRNLGKLRTRPAIQCTPPVRQIPSPETSRANPDRVKITDLLSTDTTAETPPPSSDGACDEYKIRVRQQPVAARSCGFGERDRRVIDPPPIVQLVIDNPKLSKDDVQQRLRHQFYVVHCTIWSKDGKEDCSIMPEDYRQQRRLMGSLAASSFVGEDEFGEEGCFFCFPDLSCRTSGEYRLKFSIVMLDPLRGKVGKSFSIRSSVMSEVFTVYSAKDFPGMRASTALTKRLKDQGCLISIKKGNDKPGGKGQDRDQSSEDDHDHDEGSGQQGGPSSSGKRKRSKKH